MKIKSLKDFFAGVMFIAIGIAFICGANSYKIGNAAQMGPGYFPALLGGLMVILGIAISCSSLALRTEGRNDIGNWAWRPLFYILGANFAFGVLLGGLKSIKLPAMGLITAIFALTIIASLAGKRFKLCEALIMSTILAVGSYVVFIRLLQLRFLVWPTFIPN